MDVLRHPVLPRVGTELFGGYGAAVTSAVAVFLLLAIAAIDKLTGFELRLHILYLIPVALLTWIGGRLWGVIAAALAIALWIATFRFAHPYSRDFYFYWDGGVSFALLAVFAFLFDKLRGEMQSAEEKVLEVLEELDAPVYVADPSEREVLYGNRRFRETLGERSYEVLQAMPARECAMRWPDRSRVTLRILLSHAT